MISDITNFLLDAIGSLGYLGVFLTMFLESGIFPPIPSDVMLGSVGLLVHRGEMSLVPAVFAAALGNMAGTIFLYYVGVIGGRPFIKRYGYLLFYDAENIEKSEEWFKKYGDIAILIAQFVPLMRSIISVPSGIFKKSVVKTAFYSFVGSFIWASFVIFTASRLGEQWEDLVVELDKVSTWILLVAIITIGSYFGYKIYKIRKKKIIND